MTKQLVSFSFLFILIHANAEVLKDRSKYIPPDDRVVREIGTGSRAILPSEFSILVWNIHKSKAQDMWAKDFVDLTQKSNIIITQEALWDDFSVNIYGRLNQFVWRLATSFVYKESEIPSGVMTGSQEQPLTTMFLRSRAREPIVNTPKMVLITTHAMQGTTQSLLVGNIHGMNVVFNQKFRDQIEDAVEAIKNHEGPMIFAGDFNTWNAKKKNYLIEKFSTIGLIHVETPTLRKGKWLDHVFYRDLRLLKFQSIDSIVTSDHLPILATFKNPAAGDPNLSRAAREFSPQEFY